MFVGEEGWLMDVEGNKKKTVKGCVEQLHQEFKIDSVTCTCPVGLMRCVTINFRVFWFGHCSSF